MLVKACVVCLILVILVAGCASNYVQPSTEESASISFRVEADPVLGYTAFFYYFPDIDKTPCVGSKTVMARINKGNPLTGRTTKLDDIGIPAGTTFVIRSVVIPAGVRDQYGCTFDSVVSPIADRKYLLQASWDDNMCAVSLADVTEEAPVEMEIERNRRIWC